MRLPALEKNLLVYRALQMSLFLFYAEDLRRHLVNSVGPLVQQRRKDGGTLKGAKLIQSIFRKLEDDDFISHSESVEIQALLEHRNAIAHHIYRLTGDIEVPGRGYDFRRHLGLNYDYEALRRLKSWHEKIVRRLDTTDGYWITVSSDSLLFEAAENAYENELLSLGKRIRRQIQIRKAKKANS